MLDERLSLAASLYQPCSLGADIGTDHGLLPCELLRRGICQRMLLCDISPKALRHARESVQAQGLEERARLICGDGLEALEEDCGCISIMGMGGESMAGILRRGADYLHGAVLVLSAHTEPALVRQAVMDIGYHFTRACLCQAAGRYYVVWRVEPGATRMTAEEIRYGKLLYETPSPLLRGYLRHRAEVARARLQGLRSGEKQRDTQEAERDLAFYQRKLEECS